MYPKRLIMATVALALVVALTWGGARNIQPLQQTPTPTLQARGEPQPGDIRREDRGKVRRNPVAPTLVAKGQPEPGDVRREDRRKDRRNPVQTAIV